MIEEKIKNKLRSAGLKATDERIAILSAFNPKSCHLADAETIYRKIKKLGVDKATVFRAISAFENAGILNRVDLRGDSAFYELNHGHHHHAVCTKCGFIEAVNICDDKIVKKISGILSDFDKVVSHSMELFGICKSCAKE